MKRDTDRNITIEDLLRLKRAERPPAEFWARFESEIRAKQLAAIVNKRPWWDGASRAFGVVYRNRLSFGTAAALALSVAGVLYIGGPSRIGHKVPARSSERSVVASVSVHLAPVVDRANVSRASLEGTEIGAVEAAPIQGSVTVPSVAHVTQAPLTAPVEAAARSSFGDAIAVTLADFRGAAPDVARRGVFGSDREFEPMASSTNKAVSEPLARMDPSEERRARLLAPALPAYSSGATRSLASDWPRTRASSDRIYESMDLYGSNDRAVVGFRF
jgi:hypothetical protein